MKPPYPSFTSEWHKDPYPAIDPATQPSLSHKGQTIIITGSGSGIGRATALAYAAAGAERLVLIGRREQRLQETEEKIKASLSTQDSIVVVEKYAVSVTDSKSIRDVARKVAGWDVLVLNAGTGMAPRAVEEADPDEWWNVVETNLRGFFVTANAFLPSRRASARIIGVSAGMIHLPPSTPIASGSSAYITSKLAQIRLLEHIAAENSDVFVVSVHPGVVETELLESSNIESAPGQKIDRALMDDVNLPAHFFVWASSPDATFLNGKMVWANWDVEQLKARAEEIQKSSVLTANVLGWPYTSSP